MAAKARRIRKQSLEGARAGWKLQRLIMKSNDDVRQEVFIMQVGAVLCCALFSPGLTFGCFGDPAFCWSSTFVTWVFTVRA